MPERSTLKGKVVIITGGSSGIGRATALELSKHGARVVLVARNETKLRDAANQIVNAGGEARTLVADVSRKTDCEHIVSETLRVWPAIDVFIANAGEYVQGRIVDTEIEAFERSLAVNFYGAVHGVKAVLPHMIEQGKGHFVFVNSLDAKKGIVGDGPYVAAKSALAGFAEVLRQEVHGTGIIVSSIYPGRVDTPMIEHLRVPWASPKLSAASVAKRIVRVLKTGRTELTVPRLYAPLGILNEAFPILMDRLYAWMQFEGKRK